MKVMIVGAGTMGSGIAQVFAAAGHDVVVSDQNPAIAEAGIQKLAADLERQVQKGRRTPADRAAVLARVRAGTLADAGDRDLVVEAAVEDLSIKQSVFRQLHEVCPPDTLFATNTSSISITRIGAGLGRPVTGLHFFNPAPVMALVEVVLPRDSDPALGERMMAIARELGKTPVLVQDAPGFIVNRVLIPMINEAIGILAAGTASAADIDQAMQAGANHPLGPLALSDLVGNDVVLAILEVLERDTGDPKYRPQPLLREMVAAGKLGRKSRQGFFSY